MPGRLDLIRKTLTLVLMLLLGLLILQALGYGIGFVIDPESGAREFGTAPTTVDDLTVALVRLVGVGMLGFAVLTTLTATLIWRGNPAGVYVALGLGGTYVAVGWSAFAAGWRWDAGFYGVTGALLIVLSAAVGWLRAASGRRARETPTPE